MFSKRKCYRIAFATYWLISVAFNERGGCIGDISASYVN